MRFYLKSTLVFSILISPLCAFAQVSPTRSESIVIFAPHPDDEVIGCAGIIMQALTRGAHVKVVDITSGDGFDAAAAGLTHKKVDEVGPDDFFALSRLRQTQSRNALEVLGGKADDLIVLGYPDGDLGSLYDSTDEKVIRQQFTKKNETYALIQKDYHTSVHGEPALYQRSSLLGDLVELLTTLQPTEIYVTDENHRFPCEPRYLSRLGSDPPSRAGRRDATARSIWRRRRARSAGIRAHRRSGADHDAEGDGAALCGSPRAR
jgi:LmbE family N-acetylglucosaminyl deacetylase